MIRKKGTVASLDMALSEFLHNALKPFEFKDLEKIKRSTRSISISFNYDRTKDLYNKTPDLISPDKNIAIWIDGPHYHVSLCENKLSPCAKTVDAKTFNSDLNRQDLSIGGLIESAFASTILSSRVDSYGNYYVIKISPDTVPYHHNGEDYRSSKLHISIAKDVTEYDTLPKDESKQNKDNYFALQQKEIRPRIKQFTDDLKINLPYIKKSGSLVFVDSRCKTDDHRGFPEKGNKNKLIKKKSFK